jgi:hypothetical protein
MIILKQNMKMVPEPWSDIYVPIEWATTLLRLWEVPISIISLEAIYFD